MTINRTLLITVSSILCLVLGILIGFPAHLFIEYLLNLQQPIEQSHIELIVFMEWPLFIMTGAFLGNRFYRKYQRSTSRRKRR